MGVGGVPAGPTGSRAHLYQGHTTVYVVIVAMVAASGGLLFGYDNGAPAHAFAPAPAPPPLHITRQLMNS